MIRTAPLGPVRLLVLQSTPFCNIDCTYCYLPDRRNKAKLPTQVVEALARKLVAENMLDEKVELGWHAGEPLAGPVAEYEQLIAAFERGLEGAARVEYSLQTNATLISDDWCRFFKRFGVRVGVSLDGPRAVHDKCRIDRRGKGTFEREMRGIQLLKGHGVPTYVIGVLHRDSLRIPDEMFAFFQSLGVSDICFNLEEVEGSNSSSSLNYTTARADVAAFFRRYFELIASTPGAHWLREFSYTLRRLCAKTIHNPQVTPYEMLTMDYRGDYSTFSPELIGARATAYGSLILGNVLNQDETFATSLNRAKWVLDVHAGVEHCRSTCRYFDVCGGGAPSNKVAETGTFASAETNHCVLSIQTLINAMLGCLADRQSIRNAALGARAPEANFGDLRP